MRYRAFLSVSLASVLLAVPAAIAVGQATQSASTRDAPAPIPRETYDRWFEDRYVVSPAGAIQWFLDVPTLPMHGWRSVISMRWRTRDSAVARRGNALFLTGRWSPAPRVSTPRSRAGCATGMNWLRSPPGEISGRYCSSPRPCRCSGAPARSSMRSPCSERMRLRSGRFAPVLALLALPCSASAQEITRDN